MPFFPQGGLLELLPALGRKNKKRKNKKIN